MKKLFCLLLAVLLLVSLAACNESEGTSEHRGSGDGNSVIDNSQKPGGNGQESGNVNNGGNPSDGNTNGDSEEKTPAIYQEYDNLISIGDFHNGLAAFTISGEWNQTLFGYVDIQGKVVIEPEYVTNHYYENVPTFASENYIKLNKDDVDSILDKTGAAKFTVGKNNVTGVGTPQNGYFWVETSQEEFTGYVYTVTYYSAKDMRVIATFENCESGYDSDVDLEGNAEVDHATEGTQHFNISTYDSEFKAPTSEDAWSVDVEGIEAFQGVSVYYNISTSDNTNGKIATVILINKDGIKYYSTVDQNGNVLLAPQKGIAFEKKKNYSSSPQHTFCKDLCPAKDMESGLWGYIDPQGNWKIEPQFVSASGFTSDGYAIVHSKVVIDTTGKVVLGPKGWTPGIVKDIVGTYSRIDEYYDSYRLTFRADGTLEVIKFYRSEVQTVTEGIYSLFGGCITISDVRYGNYYIFGNRNDGEMLIYQENGKLVINGTEWTKVETGT